MRRAAIPLVFLLLCPLVLGACGDTVQSRPTAHESLEALVSSVFPIFWLGGRFHDMEISEVMHDASGAYSVQYGPCVQGGQGTCTPALRVVTSPDNSFLPGGDAPSRAISVRGVPGVSLQQGRTLVVPTKGVVVSVFARTAALARAAVGTMVTINRVMAPGEALPPRRPDTGFGDEPLASQAPRTFTGG